MNQLQIVEAMAKETGQTKASTERFIAAFIEVVGVTIKKRGVVRLVGFGSFVSYKRKAKVGRNMATGKKMKIPVVSIN